jgi:hypothetical protein
MMATRVRDATSTVVERYYFRIAIDVSVYIHV